VQVLQQDDQRGLGAAALDLAADRVEDPAQPGLRGQRGRRAGGVRDLEQVQQQGKVVVGGRVQREREAADLAACDRRFVGLSDPVDLPQERDHGQQRDLEPVRDARRAAYGHPPLRHHAQELLAQPALADPRLPDHAHHLRASRQGAGKCVRQDGQLGLPPDDGRRPEGGRD
jgi:hypothetical protein